MVHTIGSQNAQNGYYITFTFNLFSVSSLNEGFPLQVNFTCLIQNQIHVLVESNNMPLDPRIHIFIQPNRHQCPVLKVPENQIDGLNHNFLNLLTASVTHLWLANQKILLLFLRTVWSHLPDYKLILQQPKFTFHHGKATW